MQVICVIINIVGNILFFGNNIYLLFLIKGPRAQIDRKLYKKYMQECLFNYPNLTIKSASVQDFIIARNPLISGDEKIYGEVRGIKLGKSLNLTILQSRR